MLQTFALSSDDLVEIRVVAPARRAMEIQAVVAEIVRRPDDLAWEPPFPANHGPKDAWELPAWSNTDYDRAAMRWIVRNLRRAQLDVLVRIQAEPGRHSTSELLLAAGYDPSKRASGVFRAIGGRFRRCDRRPLWTGGPTVADGQMLGWTTNSVATNLFRAAVDEYFGEIQRAGR